VEVVEESRPDFVDAVHRTRSERGGQARNGNALSRNEKSRVAKNRKGPALTAGPF
jgi:hypothetical protein